MDQVFLSLKKTNTKRAYLTAIRDLSTYLDSSAILKITQKQALQYIAQYKLNHSDASVKHRYHLLRSYFEYLVNTDQIKNNPFRIVPTVLSLRQHNQVRPTKTIPHEKVKLLLDSLPKNSYEEKLEFAFIAILFGGGLRRGEALNLNGANLILADFRGMSYVELKGTKSGTTEKQPIPSWIVPVLREIMLYRVEHEIGLQEKIFPWSESTAYRIFRKATKSADLDCSPHAFRAAAATMMKEFGEEDRSVAEFLRHKTTHMVQVYDHRARKSTQKTKHCVENFYKKMKKVA